MPGRIYADEVSPNDGQNVWPDGVVIRPASPDPANGVFTTWAEAHAAALLLPVPLRKIWLDNGGVPIAAQAGVYDMDKVQICGMEILPLPGAPGPSQTLVTPNGCSFTNWLSGSYNVAIEHQGAAPLFVGSTAGAVFVIMQMGERVTWRATVAPVLQVTGTGFLLLTLSDQCVLDSVSGFEPLGVLGTATCQLNVMGLTTLTANCLRSIVGTTINLAPQAALVVNYGQANLAGTFSVFSVGPSLAYVAGAAGDWVAPLPTNLQEAIDRLAAAGGVTPVP